MAASRGAGVPAARRPRHGVRRADDGGPGRTLLLLLAVGLFVIGGVVGYAWALDRQLQGGVLRQRAEAVRRPDWVALEPLPPYVPRAFLAAVDPAYLGRGALEADTRETTLSRDLVRQIHRLDDGVSGRARELIMGPLLENRLSRRQLLELYLNRVYLGTQQRYPVYGLHHAAREYFGKEPARLTPSEVATLAGLLLPPRIAEPDARPGAVGIRRNELLRQLLHEGHLTPAAYQAALREPLRFQPGLTERPMTRPAEWPSPPPVLRLPEALQPKPDTATAQTPPA